MNQHIAKYFLLATAFLPVVATASTEVRVIGEMRRMFTEKDIGANVELAKVNSAAHLFGLGPVAGLQGEVTVVDGKVFVSRVKGGEPAVTTNPDVRSVFLVYAFVPGWRSIAIPAGVHTEKELAEFVQSKLPQNTRSPFLVRGKAEQARYHIQNYLGAAKDLTHESHDEAKVFFELKDAAVELVGFFTNREGDAGSFVHMGQTTHMHVISADRKQMGHLEALELSPGATLLLPE